MDPTGRDNTDRNIDRLVTTLRSEGCRDADRLVPFLYEELRAMARRCLGSERPDHTLQPTALVHEAYLRLARRPEVGCESREQFLFWAARVMRQVLVEHARARKRRKRGGAATRVPLDRLLVSFEECTSDLDLVDDALEALAILDARKSRIVELRFFGGLTVPEVAKAMGLGRATVEREWRFARAWLHAKLTVGDEST